MPDATERDATRTPSVGAHVEHPEDDRDADRRGEQADREVGHALLLVGAPSFVSAGLGLSQTCRPLARRAAGSTSVPSVAAHATRPKRRSRA